MLTGAVTQEHGREPLRTPVVLGPPQRRLHGFLHVPSGRSGQTGFVLCNPLGYEAMCTHRTYLALANGLARAGFHALRYDHFGAGDSWGVATGPGLVQSWVEGVELAVAELRARAGVRRVMLFGVRFGAALAAVAGARMGDVDAAILWAPSWSGRGYVRELRAFRLIKSSKLEPLARPDGGEAIAGYLFDKATLAEMSAVDLLAQKAPIARRVLIVSRDDLVGGEERLAAHLESTGAQVRLAADAGYSRMMRDAQDSIVPVPTLETMIAWAREAPQAEPTARGPTELPASVSATVNGATETGVLFGEDRRLFGILAEPAQPAASPDRPCVLLLNVGANHHVGPNRMYVVLARELAARGYSSFRFDVAGLGDSLIAPGARENRLYSKDSVGDVKAAMSFVAQARGTKRFVLVGLCSGAYLAFHTAVEDQRVCGQVLLNPQTFEWKEGDSLELSARRSYFSTRFYARAAMDYRVWLRVARGEVDVRGIAGALRGRVQERIRGGLQTVLARVGGRSVAQTEVERAFHALSDRGVESLLVFSFEDGGLDMIATHLGHEGRKMRGRRNFALEIVEGADHTFTPLSSQTALYELLLRHISARFA